MTLERAPTTDLRQDHALLFLSEIDCVVYMAFTIELVENVCTHPASTFAA